MEITTGTLASLVNGVIEGDSNVVLSGFAKIEEAGQGQLSFIANPKYSHFIESTNASALLVSSDFNHPNPKGVALIKVADPYATLAELLRLIQSRIPRKTGRQQPSFVDESASLPADTFVGAFSYIGKNASIGKDVEIYPQCYIGDDVEIGDNCKFYPGVKIYDGCKIGNNCILHSGVVVGSDGFGFAPNAEGAYDKIPQTGIVVLEDDVEIGANTTVDRATFGCTRIGKGTKLDNLIMVAHNVEIGRNNVFAAQTGVAGSTKIGSGNRIGGQVGFSGHIKVGDNNEIGAQSGVPGNVGDGNKIMGYPAVERRKFAKNLVYINRLEELFDELRKTKK